MEFNVQTARDYAGRGQLQEWVLLYLKQAPKPNPNLLDLIADHQPLWIGPIEVELGQLVRCCGPEKTANIGWPEPQALWDGRVDESQPV